MIPKTLLGSNDDYIESLRRYLYPKLHPYLTTVGGYAVGEVGEKQRVGRIEVKEETFEKILGDLGFIRNPVACLKSEADGDVSEGSWVLLSEDAPAGKLNDDRQLHITLMPAEEGGLDVYAHEEYDWRVKPLRHLRGVKLRKEYGRKLAGQLLNERTYLEVK